MSFEPKYQNPITILIDNVGGSILLENGEDDPLGVGAVFEEGRYGFNVIYDKKDIIRVMSYPTYSSIYGACIEKFINDREILYINEYEKTESWKFFANSAHLYKASKFKDNYLDECDYVSKKLKETEDERSLEAFLDSQKCDENEQVGLLIRTMRILGKELDSLYGLEKKDSYEEETLAEISEVETKLKELLQEYDSITSSNTSMFRFADFNLTKGQDAIKKYRLSNKFDVKKEA